MSVDLRQRIKEKLCAIKKYFYLSSDAQIKETYVDFFFAGQNLFFH